MVLRFAPSLLRVSGTRVAAALIGVVILSAAMLGCEADEVPQDGTPSSTPGASSPTSERPALGTPTPQAPPGLTAARVTRVVDGDTIEVDIRGKEYTVRYIGVDTPETVHPSQPVGCFGPEASARNKRLVEGKTVGLERDVSETDRYGRLLRYVWMGDEMVNAALVRDGYAQASTYPPDVKHQELFLDLQREAREAGRGLWGTVCSSATPVPTGESGACDYSGTGEAVIKGNISSRTGERIYHVPGQQYYEETVINEAAGEQWFCTEREAQDAGWRKSKV